MNKKLRQYQYYVEKKRRNLHIAALFGVIIQSYIKTSARDIWVKPWVARRKDHGHHHNLFLELSLKDPNKFRRCLRMDTNTFEFLVQKVTLLIQRQNTHLRECISPAERLSVTLRHLATGETQQSLSLSFRLGQSTISGIIRDTCSALIRVLQVDYLKFPCSEEEWRVVATDFGERWNFFNCIGALDGKHVLIDPPQKSGSLYYNYKNNYSIVLLALIDAQLRFIYVDVGTNGRISDSGIWNKSTLKAHIDNNSLKIPPAAPLLGTETEFPFVIVGDEGFPLSTNILIPYPGASCTGRIDRRIFNYRLSRARRCSENAFGVMAARFQIFRSPMRYDPHCAKEIVLVCCCLHNMLRSQVVGRAMYTPSIFLDKEDVFGGEMRLGDWRNESVQGIVNFVHQGGNRHSNPALQLRDMWCAYFNTVRAVPWQMQMIHS
ncbi:protein ALP1-like [Monomorium pharaonis]|uniref:protein ALP1-like n=1 Tax=Monomorium pharaonis TaxID=307658 RepID=UPI001747D614|nr:protein ALP1-like [Monomorium pharaonis]